ncbi:MAG: DUF4197 domain-containing protein [Marinilabiliaceae bacterium]|nr:DUF4197 domain-containing protein [Marinilabiliaceae bacterium]
MKKIACYLFVFTFLTLQSCDLNEVNALTEAEVIEGLKAALSIGTENAAGILSATDGYFLDAIVKILLPPEAKYIIDQAKDIDLISESVKKLESDLLLSINRSAEAAAKEVGPIFLNAITNLTIQDGFAILRDEKDEELVFMAKNTYPAATRYLEVNTYNPLKDLFQPKIKSALDIKIVEGFSANQTWNSLTSLWNNLPPYLTMFIDDYKKVDTELDTYLTEKALDGLFFKIAIEEEKIRTDPLARVTDILKRVFGE